MTQRHKKHCIAESELQSIKGSKQGIFKSIKAVPRSILSRQGSTSSEQVGHTSLSLIFCLLKGAALCINLIAEGTPSWYHLRSMITFINDYMPFSIHAF